MNNVNKIKVLALITITFLFTGCKINALSSNNSLSEKQIIEYIEKNILEQEGDKVKAKILSKENVRSCSAYIFNSVCIYSSDIEDVYRYNIEIKNEEENIVATGTYTDSYLIYDKENTNEVEIKFEHNYFEQKGLSFIKTDYNNLLNEYFSKYFLYVNNTNDGYNIFINIDENMEINDLLLKLDNIRNKYLNYISSSFTIYIYTDNSIFENKEFDKYLSDNRNEYNSEKDLIEKYTNKDVRRIGHSQGFDDNLFLNMDKKEEYRYFIFTYTSSKIIGEHMGEMQVFGIK